MNEQAINSLITIASVLVGGGLAFSTSWCFARRIEKDRELSVAYSLMFKVQKFTNNLMQLNQHVAETSKAASEAGVDGPAWARYADIVGFTGLDAVIHADELALIAKTKDAQLVMDVRELESAHSIALSAISKIQEMRDELGKSGLIKKVEGQTVSFEASQEQFANIAPLLINLETLASGTFASLPEMAEHASQTCMKLGPHLKKHYKFRHFINLAPSV